MFFFCLVTGKEGGYPLREQSVLGVRNLAELSNTYLHEQSVILCDGHLSHLAKVLHLNVLQLVQVAFITKHLHTHTHTYTTSISPRTINGIQQPLSSKQSNAQTLSASLPEIRRRKILWETLGHFPLKKGQPVVVVWHNSLIANTKAREEGGSDR